MTIYVKKTHFSGLSKVYDADGDGLGPVVHGMLQTIGRLVAANVTDLTDSSSGTSNGNTVAAIPSLAAYTTAGTDLSPKAGWDTAMGKVRNAIATLAAQVNTIHAKLPVGALTDNSGGTSGAGTVAALDKTLTAVDGTDNTGLAYASAQAQVVAFRNAISELIVAVNKVAVATGKTALTDSTGGTPAYTATIPALTATSGSGVTGAAANGVADTVGDATLTAFAHAIATIAAKLNACTGSSSSDLTVSVIAR